MGTRAIYGFKKGFEYKVTIRCSDGYVSELGRQMIEFCSHTTVKELNSIYDNMKLVNEEILPTEEQIQKYYDFRNDFYYSHLLRRNDPITWHSLIDLASNNPINWKSGLDIMVNAIEELNKWDTEFTYIIDLNDNKLYTYNKTASKDTENSIVGEFVLKNI